MSRSIHTLALALTLAALPFAVACEKTGTETQEKANEAQNKANVEITNAVVEANEKAKQAQAEADKAIATAQAAFSTAREDYRHRVQSDIDALNRQLDDLDAKAKTATGTKRTDLRATIPALRSQRDAFVANFQSLGNASAATWDATKAHLDKEWADLKAAVDKAE